MSIKKKKKALVIYECVYECEDCKEGNPTHNSFHFPHTTMEFVFNGKFKTIMELAEEFDSIREIESYSEEEMKNGLNGLFPSTYSWTQLAIARCNELSR